MFKRIVKRPKARIERGFTSRIVETARAVAICPAEALEISLFIHVRSTVKPLITFPPSPRLSEGSGQN